MQKGSKENKLRNFTAKERHKMIFNQSYFTAMDRGYYMPLQPGQGMPGERVEDVPEIGISPKDIGVSAHPAQDQLQQVKARIFQGASKVELGFFGRGKGSFQGGNTTPEMYGKEERIDMRELAKINKIQLTTHATTAAGSLAGFGQQGFDEHVREQSLHEIERAVDFAADVSRGGAIVVHANEYPRAIKEYFEKERFEAYPEEEERAVLYLVDERTGQLVPVRKNMPVHEPLYKETEDKTAWLDIDGKPIPKDLLYHQVNEKGEWVKDGKVIKPEELYRKLFQRVPEFNEEGTDFKTERRDWDYFAQRAGEWNKLHPDDKKTAEEMWFRIQTENAILRAKGSSLFYARDYERSRKDRDKVVRALKFYEQLEKTVPPEEAWKMAFQEPQFAHFAGLVPPETRHPVEYLKELLKREDDNLRFMHEASAAADAEAATQAENITKIKPIEQYALGKTADTVARAAMYAWDKGKHLREDVTKGEKLEKPLFISVENFFPEQYGGHPDEIKRIVEESRKKMVAELTDPRNSEKYGEIGVGEAEKMAKEHIKATWDTGHAFIWKKYFKGSDEEFKKWYLDKAKEWKDQGVMGHVHVSDNFGWEDEHVIPGQGIAPIKEFIQLIRDKVDKGEIDVIVEPAHQDYRALLGGWRVFGSSIYGTSMGQKESWAGLERSYFGRTAPPSFLYGESAPDPEAWTMWTGVRLE
ncbi:sugar phosphate isomerase/epimerase [Candidatus Woesearchaeota archaeon]|nr:sugar phosphate isomerase/epimerase [Candidatus Woesearchaeota archaeon]